MHDATNIPQDQTSAPSVDSAEQDVLNSASDPRAISEFRPAIGLRNGNAQTLYGTLRPGIPEITGTLQRRLTFPDGDIAVMHDDRPETWERGDHVVLLMHGLAGCHRSGYMARIASKLLKRGVRVFRMDHRGCGASRYLARHPCHAGRIRDVESAIRMLERLCPGSPVSVAGFSLSGNLLLRYLGEEPESLPLSLYRAVAVCPPVDLLQCANKISSTRMGQQYDWYFARQMINQIVDTPLWRDDLPIASAKRLPRRIMDFDEQYTAPAAGFNSAFDYYENASAISHLSKIQVHTSILASEDDPLICPRPFARTSLPANVSLYMTRHGGHMGFVGRKSGDNDKRWMDWRVVDWLLK